MDGAYRALDRLRGDGAIGAVSVGVNDGWICLRFAEAGDFDGFMLAGRCTLLDHGALDEFLPHCAEQGTGVLTAAPSASGILASGTAVEGARYFIGETFATVLTREVPYRSFANRRQLASYVGLAPMPH